jgi:hypothetical protein
MEISKRKKQGKEDKRAKNKEAGEIAKQEEDIGVDSKNGEWDTDTEEETQEEAVWIF